MVLLSLAGLAQGENTTRKRAILPEMNSTPREGEEVGVGASKP